MADSSEFQKFDVDKSGFIDVKELLKGLQGLYPTVTFTQDYLNTLLAKFDSNNDGVLDPEEFKSLVAYVKDSPPQ